MKRPLMLAALFAVLGSGDAHAYPVEVQNCFETEVFDQAPKRALVNDTNMVQTVLDLGLADRFVAVSGISGVEDKLIDDPNVIAGLNQFVTRYPSLESVLGLNPDFMFAGWSYGFSETTGLNPDSLARFGVKTYTLRESCVRIGEVAPISMETLYADIEALGKIFGIERRAGQVEADLRARVADVERRLEGVEQRPRVMYCDHCHVGTPPVSAGAQAMTSLIIRLGGGQNIFDDVADSYIRVSWEEMIRRDPQWIIVNDHRVPIEDTITYLTAQPELSHIEAIRKRQFIPLTYAEQTPSTRSVDGLEKIARALHPERFGE
ncbi:ABC transporter substrate-binding protein [Methyloligella sp. 2.7D]|uniref:ABC transporter substrate-binding protein n=1 Tax=unclassified Methyloligella TaxID=2625955 RepID=UPI00157DDFAF|nr:ABC transporter substrate-binding protein [Methyloligella sp. GL2]QKP78231.1 ABC transporter substrate-binding protein [Methyloligella sp. GL2]